MSVNRAVASGLATVFVVIGLAACSSDDSPVVTPNSGATTITTLAGTGSTRPTVQGFGSVAFRVQGSAVAQRCALLAATEQQQEKGLMDASVLPGYDGMIFQFSADTTTAFWMKDTSLPLSIAWFDSSGRFVSSTDMEPCIGKPDSACPLFTAAAPYRYALEVPKGNLSSLGIGPGSVISVGGACT